MPKLARADLWKVTTVTDGQLGDDPSKQVISK